MGEEGSQAHWLGERSSRHPRWVTTSCSGAPIRRRPMRSSTFVREVSTEMTSWQSSGRTRNARVRDGSPDAADDASDCFDPNRAAAPPPLETWLSWEGIRTDTQVILLMARFSAGLRAHGHLAQPSPPAAGGEGFGRTRAAAQVARPTWRDLSRGRPGTVPPGPRLAGCRNHAPGEPRNLFHRLPGRP